MKRFVVLPLLVRLVIFFLVAGSSDCFAQGAHSTSFSPQSNGFQFANTFTNTISNFAGISITSGGLCGGMSYAALDYYMKKARVPAQNYPPIDHTTLYNYFYGRQTTSIESNVDRWAELLVNPLGSRTNEFFSWGLKGGSGGQLQVLKSYIDRGIPVPLGLFESGDGGIRPHHQVLAIGYNCGRYNGDLGQYQDDFQLFCYNPNFPDQITTLVPNSAQHYYYWKGNPDNSRYITYFVDSKYSPQDPPAAAAVVQEPHDCLVHDLIVNFNTGGDDLRGGGDNCNVTVYFANGSSQTFLNVNNNGRWVDNTANTVDLPLNTPVPPGQLKSFSIYTKSCGGISCDNWNLNGVSIAAQGGFSGQIPVMSQQGSQGSPLLHRFTGSDYTYSLNFNPVSTPCMATAGVGTGSGAGSGAPSGVNQLLVNITTGDDDLRGGNDNLKLVLTYRDGSQQTFSNVNQGQNWPNNSQNQVPLQLSKLVQPADIRQLTLQINHCSGMSCDNWKFNGITIRALGNGVDKVISARTGNPTIKYLKGNDNTCTITF
jgi:hypothetical protein